MKNKKTSLIVLVAVSVVLAVALFFIIKNAVKTTTEVNQEPVTIKFAWWGTKERHDNTVAAINLWNEENPLITVEPYFQGWDGYMDKLRIQLAGDTAPDIFQFEKKTIGEFASKGVLLDLTPHTDTFFAALDKSLWKDVEVEGKVYSLPSGVNTQVLIYNKTKLEQMGIPLPTNEETWDSLLEKCKLATRDTDGDGKTDIFGIQDPLISPLAVVRAALNQQGLDFYNKDLKSSTLDDPKVIAVYKKLEEFKKSGVCPTLADVSLKSGQGFLDAGYTVFSIQALGTFTGVQAKMTDELGMAPPPETPGGVVTSALQAGVELGIYVNSKNQNAALKFLSWFVGNADAGKKLGMARSVLPSKVQRDAVMDLLDPVNKKVVEIATIIGSKNAVLINKNPVNTAEWEKIYLTEREKYEFNRITLEEFLKNVKQNADPVLVN